MYSSFHSFNLFYPFTPSFLYLFIPLFINVFILSFMQTCEWDIPKVLI